MIAFDTKTSPSTDYPCPDCFAFLNWDEEDLGSVDEKSLVFRSLVATVKLQPALDVSLEAKAVRFLHFVDTDDEETADAFLFSFGRTTDESLTNFIQSIVTLISSASQDITVAAMKMLNILFCYCSNKVRLALVKTNLIPQLINTLNPLSLSVVEAEDVQIYLIHIISYSFWNATPNYLFIVGITDLNEQQAVQETVLKQVIVPSENYICHFCVNRFSIIDGALSQSFLKLLAHLLHISPYHPPVMDFILHMPVVPTIPSCISFFDRDESIWNCLSDMIDVQREWDKKDRDAQQMRKTVHRMLRMEGIEDMIEEKVYNDQDEDGEYIVPYSIGWNNQQGMNFRRPR
ncbi:hypothetical protein BLNAU_14683 [Blattamonas nauphoetae]|uniref:Uncharacterized protein n=1 Tax=Blattamonas nauphoetae TaxID=2049346 RepID=A0ABQ9XCX7_9EUKA|nr:hypothetical protein BLNAU_14683 [Blattamonas nauphoetae]